jgi:hypothetical protein
MQVDVMSNRMQFRNRFLGIVLLILMPFLTLAQDIGVGQWRIHLPYNAVQSLAESPNKLYVGAERGFYSMDKQSGEVELYSKVNGFSDVEVAKLAWHDSLSTLVIAYENTNIDLLQENQIINISDILRKSILGIKTVYDIHLEDQYAYLGCSFGIVVVDLVKHEISDSYTNFGPNGSKVSVQSLTFHEGKIYAATNFGILSANQNEPTLGNFQVWKLERTGFFNRHIRSFGGLIYADIDSVMYTYDGTTWELFEGGSKQNTVSIEITHDQLVIAQHGGIIIFDKTGGRRFQKENIINFAILDQDNNIWTGGDFTGLLKIEPSGQYGYIWPNGPLRNTSFRMASFNGKIWVVGGGVNDSWQPIFNSSGYYRFDGARWTNKHKDAGVQRMFDFVCLEPNEAQNEIWLGTRGAGLLHIKDGQVQQIYDETNSGLKRVFGFVNVTGMQMDEDGNLWMASYDSDEALVVKTKENEWNSFKLPVTRSGEMVIDEYGQKWIIAPRENGVGIMVFKELDGPLGSTSLIRSLTTSANSGNLPSNVVNALALDDAGRIWVGTEQGLTIFYNPELVFEGGEDADAQQIIIDDGRDIGYLLGNEVINDITIDGADRKWIATTTGAWLVAADGSSVLRHFTAENSPLLSNNVRCVGIMPESGEVFFGTDKGIISYRGDASEGSDLHGDVKVFPNPVRPEYNGNISITGLPENATVKITDVAGRLVYEMISNGGTAVWDGRNFNGQKPVTGIYLIFSANEKDEDALVSKLLIVR